MIPKYLQTYFKL